MSKRYCIVWDDPKTPKSPVITIEDEDAWKTTPVVLNLLVQDWGWTHKELDERSASERVHVVEITHETQTDPRVIGTMALFLDNGESGNDFAGMINVYRGGTAKQALMERAELSDTLTFKLPSELLRTTFSWVGKPLLTKIVKEGVGLSYTVIGFVLFIDRSLAKALEIVNLRRWYEEPSNGYVWPSQVIRDFSDYMGALCAEHGIDPPCQLE